MEGIDWSGEQNVGKWMAAIDGRDMDTKAAKDGRNGDTGREAGKDGRNGDTKAAIHGRNGDMGREADKDDGGGTRGRPRTTATGHESGQGRPRQGHGEGSGQGRPQRGHGS